VIRASAARCACASRTAAPALPRAERERVFDRFYRTPCAATAAIADGHGATLALGRSQRLGGLSVEVRRPQAAG